MKIHITKDIYDKLSKDDKLRYIFISTDPNFEKLVLQTRKNLNIPSGSWKKVDTKTVLFTTDKEGKSVPYGDWENEKINDKKTQEKIVKEVGRFIKNYPILNESWNNFLEMLICYDYRNFFPNKYSFAAQNDGSIHIKINHVITPSDFINWVKDNWNRFENLSKISLPTHLLTAFDKKPNLPTYDNLKNIIKIIKLKKLKRKAKDIGLEVDKADLPGQEIKINKAYHKIKKQLTKLEKETKNLREKENSIFGK